MDTLFLDPTNTNVKLHDNNYAVCTTGFRNPHQRAAVRADTTLSPHGSSAASRNLMDMRASKSEPVFTAAGAGRAEIAGWLKQGVRVCLDGYQGPFKMSGPSQGSLQAAERPSKSPAGPVIYPTAMPLHLPHC